MRLNLIRLFTISLLGIVCLPVSTFAQDVEAGATLYTSLCQSCHGDNGDGNGPLAETMVLKPRDFALAAFKLDTDADWQRGTDTDLANVIRQGTRVFGGSAVMPPWPQLTDEEINNLIGYIRSVEGVSTGEP